MQGKPQDGFLVVFRLPKEYVGGKNMATAQNLKPRGAASFLPSDFKQSRGRASLSKQFSNMKRIIIALFGFLLLAAPATVQAQIGSDDDYIYTINREDTNTITITGYTGPGGAVTIPTNIDGLLVSSIGSNAFVENANPIIPPSSQSILTSVTIPGSITNIGDDAFALCEDMTNATLMYGVTSIGAGAFDRCEGLISIAIPSSVTSIGSYAFDYCASLPSVTIPASVTNMGEGAFETCGNLTIVKILDGVTSLGPYTFESCGLLNVTIPASVTSIGDGAFMACNLTNVTIGNGVTNIGPDAFSWCFGLTSVYFMGNAPTADSTLFSGAPGIYMPEDPAMVYYFPGTTGWSNAFGGVPTKELPSISFTANPTNGLVPLTVSFTSSAMDSAGNAITNWTWNFGDGVTSNTSTTTSVAHTYTNNGTFSIALVETNNNGVPVAGSVASATVIYVGIPPSITTQPASPPPTQVGLFATFTVNVSGSPPLIYQWSLNGVPLSTGGDFSGANSPTLTVDPVSVGDAGTYLVAVSSFYGATNSSNAVLSVLADTNAMEYFEAGTNYLAASDFVLANLSFSNALNASPTNATYIFFCAASELLSLPDQPAGSNFLNHLGCSSAGRDIIGWQARLTNEIPIGVNADEITAQLRTNVLPAIIAAENSLAQITDTNFTVDLTTNETHAGAVTVDWGDVQLLRAMCDAAELFIYTTYSWNLDAQLTDVASILATKDNSFQTLLARYTNALTTTSTSDLPLAKGAFADGINEYFAASQFIRNRNLPLGETRLFNLNPNNKDDVERELKFRETLGNLLDSLNGPVVVFTNSPNTTVSAQAFFSGNFSLRSYLPQFRGSDFIWDSFPDVTFGGIFTGLTENQVSGGFAKYFHSVLPLPPPLPPIASGSLSVALLPAAAVSSGARWQVDSGANLISGVTLTNLSAGSHTVSFTIISGWVTPPKQTLTIINGEIMFASGIYTLSNAPGDELTLLTNGSGTIQHGVWLPSLVIGNKYKVTAVPKAKNVFVNWVGGTAQPYSALSSSASYTFTMEPNLLLEANFETNFFLAAQGTYRGLFAPTDSTREQTNSGSFSFSVTSGRALSGNLDLGGQTVPLSGKFDLGGAANLVSKRPHGEPSLNTTLQLDFPNQLISGTVSDGHFTAGLSGYQGVFSSSDKATNFEGQYSLVIPGMTNPAVGPFGTGYGTAKVSPSGAITLAGSLADGTAISQSSVVSQYGNWPLYVSLYGGKGSLWGWIYFTDHTHTLAAPSGLSWINTTNSCKTAVYRSGFTNQEVTVIGGLYLPGEMLPADLTATLTGGNLSCVITNGVTISSSDKITLTNLVDETNKLKLTISKSTGVIGGSFANPAEPQKTIKINGVIQQGQTNAQGYFLGTNQSGTFTLDPQ